MLVQDIRTVKAQKVKQWWVRTRQYTGLIDRLSSGNVQDLNRVRDVEACIYKLNAQFKAVETTPYPKESRELRQTSLALMMNMITVLQHKRLGNDTDSKVIFDVAMVNKNMLEFHLEEFGLSM